MADTRLVALRSTGHDEFSADFERRDGTTFTVESALVRNNDGTVVNIRDTNLLFDTFGGTAAGARSIFEAIVKFCLVAQEEEVQQVDSFATWDVQRLARPAHVREAEERQIAAVRDGIRNANGFLVGSLFIAEVTDEVGLDTASLRLGLLEAFADVDGCYRVVDSIVWLWFVKQDKEEVDRLLSDLLNRRGLDPG